MWPFRRKSDGAALSPERGVQRRAQPSPHASSLDVPADGQHGQASSEITAQVYYLGAMEVGDSKSIPTMVKMIRELKGKSKSSAPGKNCRLVEFHLKRDQLTLYESTNAEDSSQNVGDQQGKHQQQLAGKKRRRTSSSSGNSHQKQQQHQSGHVEMLDDSLGGGDLASNQLHSGILHRGSERVPIFRVHASSIAMCLQESLFGSKSSSGEGTDHFALNMTEVVPVRMTGGQMVPRRIHWCHVFRAKSHTEAQRLVQCIAYTFMQLGQKTLMRAANANLTAAERSDGSIFSRHDTDSHAVMSVSSSSPSPPMGRRRSLHDSESGHFADGGLSSSQGALHHSHGGMVSRLSNSSVHSNLSGSTSAISGHQGGRPASAGLSHSYLSGSLGTVLERDRRHVTPESRHRTTLSMASSVASELSGGSQGHSSPSNTLPRHSQVALTVEAELDESSGVHASDLAPETTQIILSNAQLRSNCSLQSSSETDDDFQAALFAIGSGDNDKLQVVLDRTVPANGEDGNNHTLMHYAAAWENVEAIKILVRSGCRVDTRDAFGWMALHRSAVRGCRDVLRTLLKSNAEINGTDHWGSTPLHHCVNAQQSRYLECTYALVEHGAFIDTPNKAKIKPVDLLPELKEMQKRLVSSLSGALSKLPSRNKSFPEEEADKENPALVPSPEITTITDILEASDDRHSSNLSSPHAPFAPPTTPANEVADPYVAEVRAMQALVGGGPRSEVTSWNAQERLKEESLKQLDETFLEVSTGSNPTSPNHLAVLGGSASDLPPLAIPRSNSSVIKEQLDQLVDRGMEQLSTRASSSGERDMPSRPMSRRVSASKSVSTAARTEDAGSKKETKASSHSPVNATDSQPPKTSVASRVESASPSQPQLIPKKHAMRKAESLDQPSSVSPSPEKGSFLDNRHGGGGVAEVERPYGITRFKTASQRKQAPVKNLSNGSLHSGQGGTPPKMSSSTPGELRLTPKQNRLNVDIADQHRQPSPLQRHKHSISQPILPMSSSSQGTHSDGTLSRRGELTDTSQEQLQETLADQDEDEQGGDEESAGSAILHLLFMLSRNPECHRELLAHLALPANADRLVAMAHVPNASMEDLSKIALLLQNMLEIDGMKGRKAAISAGMLNVIVAMCNTPRALQLPCLNLLEELLGAPNERRHATQLSSVNCLPLLDLLIPLDNDSGIDPRRHATPPLHMRRSSYIGDYEYDGRSLASSFSGVSDYSMFTRHSALKLLSMASYYEKMQKHLSHRRALLVLKERTVEDPGHMISLALEILANIAMQVDVHPTLEEHGILAAAKSFLSSSSSGRQRYHAARLLVYTGQQNVGHTYLFDPKIVNVLASNDIITMTSDPNSPVRAATIERLVELVTSNRSGKLWGELPLMNPKVSMTTATNPAEPSGNSSATFPLEAGEESPPLPRHRTSDGTPDAQKSKTMSPGRIIDFVLCTYRTMVHPIIFLRLLLHRMREPRTCPLFDWNKERSQDWDEPTHQWSIDVNSRLRPEHMYTMRVLEVWLDSYASDFQEFPVMLEEVSTLLDPLKRVGGPYMECYTRLKQLIKDASCPKELLDVPVRRQKEMPLHNELYAQCQQMIVNGEQPCSEEDAIFLAALQIHIENIAGVAPARRRFSKFRGERSSVYIKTKRCLPAELSKNKSVLKKVKSVYQQIADRGLSERNAKHFYVRRCYSMDSHGCKFYRVKEKALGRNKSVRRFLGVSPSCIVILDEKTKTLQASHNFTRIRKWTPLNEKISIMFEFETATIVFQLESMPVLVELRRHLDHCIEALDWQKVRNLDNSPWSLLAENEGIWGLDAICNKARTRAVREMFMMNMETRQQQEQIEGEDAERVGGPAEDEDELPPMWDNNDDERLEHSDSDEERELDEELGADPLRALRDLNQTLEEAQELDVGQSLDTSTFSMSATRQDLDLSASFNSPTGHHATDSRLSQSFAGSSHLVDQHRLSPFLENRASKGARKIVSSQNGHADGSPAPDTVLGGGIDDAWVSAARFTDPAGNSKSRELLSRESFTSVDTSHSGAGVSRISSARHNRTRPIRSPSSASQETNTSGGRKTSMSMVDLSTQQRPRPSSALSTKHSRPISAASLSESLQALSPSGAVQTQSRPSSRQRSHTLTDMLNDEHTGRASPLARSQTHKQTRYGHEGSDERISRVRAHTDSCMQSSDSPGLSAKGRHDRSGMAVTSTPQQSAGKQFSHLQRYNPLSNSPHFTRNPLFTNSPLLAHRMGTTVGQPASNSPSTLQRQRIAVEAGYTPLDSPYTAHRAMHAPLSPSLWGSETLARFQSMPVLGQGDTTTLNRHSPQLQHTLDHQPELNSSSGRINQLGNTMARFAPAAQSAAQRVASGQQCKCAPDAALVPGFSLLEITVGALLEIPKELARQMTLIDHDFFCKIKLPDFLQKLQPSRPYQVSSKEALQAGVAVGQCAQHFGRIASFVCLAILQEQTAEGRAEIVRQFLATAKYLYQLRNFSGMLSILVAGLGSSTIRRLSKTWEFVPKADMDAYHKMEKLLNPKDNYKAYREMVSTAATPAVPFIGLCMKDLTFLSDGNPDYVAGGVLNMQKRKQFYAMYHQMHCFQQHHYNYTPLPMVQDFLLNQDHIDDEVLHQLSRRVEPPVGRGVSQLSLST